MEIFELLETLEDIIEKSRNVPFSSKGIIDKEEMLDLIKEIRLKLPDELKQAKWVKEERQRIIADAEAEAQKRLNDTQNQIVNMIDEHVITKQAQEQKEQILENANKVAKEISVGTREYADALLEKVEEVLKETIDVVHKNRKELKSN